jgi:hypothetical protein
MRRALRQRRRWWLGPAPAPVTELVRIVGPEHSVPYPRAEADWQPRLSGIAASIRAGWEVPPVIASPDGGKLRINDGNHRFEAQRQMGRDTVETVIFFDDRTSCERFRPPWAANAVRSEGVPR